MNRRGLISLSLSDSDRKKNRVFCYIYWSIDQGFCYSCFRSALLTQMVNCRQEQFEKSAAGRAAIKQMAAMKQSNVSDKGEPVLKVIWTSNIINFLLKINAGRSKNCFSVFVPFIFKFWVCLMGAVADGMNGSFSGDRPGQCKLMRLF